MEVHMCKVVDASVRLGLTESELFQAAYHHEGLTGWQEAYALWCEKGKLPTRGVFDWFEYTCDKIISGVLVLHRQEPEWSRQDIAALLF